LLSSLEGKGGRVGFVGRSTGREKKIFQAVVKSGKTGGAERERNGGSSKTF